MPEVTKNLDFSPTPDLPPPGDARREELKQRADALEERAEKQFGESGSIDPEKLEIDQDIASILAPNLNILAVTDQQPGWRYKWVYTGQNGVFLSAAKLQGWIVVQGDSPEAEDLKWVDSTRKLADTILMKIPEAKYQLIIAKDRQARRLQQEGVLSEIEEMGAKTKGVIVHSGRTNPALLRQMQQRAQAQSIATQRFNQMLRQGSVPGSKFKE